MPNEPRTPHRAWAGLVIATVMTLAACGTPSTTTTTGNNADGTTGTALAAAVEATLAEPTGRSVVVVTFDQPTGSEPDSLYFTEIQVGGTYDVSSGRAEATFTVRGVDPSEPTTDESAAWGPGGAPLQSWADAIVAPDGLTSRIITDLPSAMSFSSEDLPDSVTGGTNDWISEPIGEWRNSALYEPRGMDDLDTGRSFVAYLNAAADVQSRPDGDRTRYNGVVRTADLPEPRPITSSEGEVWATPDVPFTAWVDADGFVTRVELTMDGVDDQLIPWDTSATAESLPPRTVDTVRISVELTALGEPVSIELPPADQVKTFDEMYPTPNLTDLIPPEQRAAFCADPPQLPIEGEFGGAPDPFAELCAELPTAAPG